MAVTIGITDAAWVTATLNGTDTYTTGSFTPSANVLLVAVGAVCNGNGATTTGLALANGGSGVTWTQLCFANDGSAAGGGAAVWVADSGSSPVSQTAVITAAPSTVLDCDLLIFEANGAANAAAQIALANTATVIGTQDVVTITPTYTGSLLVGACGQESTTAFTANGSTTLFAATATGSSGGRATAFYGTSNTTAGTPVTIGATATRTKCGIAGAEIYPVLTITTTSLPTAPVGYAYSYTLQAAGGAPPYTWSVSAGSLGWASLAGSTGIISGTPTSGNVGAETFTIEVTDNNSKTATMPFNLTVQSEYRLQSARPGYPSPSLFVPGELIAPSSGPVHNTYSILLQYGGGSTGFPAVPGITVPGATDPGTPSQVSAGGLSVSASIARKNTFRRTLAAVSTVRGNITRRISRAFTAVLAITSTPKVGFSFFNQILPLGSLSSSVASTSDLGIQFNVTSSGYALSGYYVYIPSGGDTTASNYTFALYSTTNGTSGTQVGTTATGSGTFTAAAWNYVSLSSPLGLVNGTTYVATYHLIANDPYEYVLTYWSVGLGAGGITNGPITAPGTGTALGGNQEAYNQPAGASIAFPASNYMGSWYGIDVEVIGGTSAIQHLLTIAASLVTNSGNLGREIFITLPGKVWKQLF